MATSSQGERIDAEEAVVEARERLDGDVGDAEQDARRAAEHDAVVVVRGAEARAGDQQRADHEHRGLEGDHARERVRGVDAPPGPAA